MAAESRFFFDPDLDHVYNVLCISYDQQECLLEVASVESVNDVLEMKRELSLQQVEGVKPQILLQLFYFVCWYTYFEAVNQRPPNVLTEFDWNAYREFLQDPSKKVTAEQLIDLELHQHDDARLFRVYLRGKREMCGFICSNESRKLALIDFITSQIQEKLNKDLRKRCFFNITEAICLFAESILEGHCPFTTKYAIMAHGPTQSGKSAFKAVLIAVCDFMRVPCIIITKDKQESEDLCSKLLKYAAGSLTARNIFSLYDNAMKPSDIFNEIEKTNRGCIIIPDFASKIKMVRCSFMENYKRHREERGLMCNFAVVVDECDAMDRTSDRRQKMEQEMQSLNQLGPCLHVLVSATPDPTILIHKEELKKPLKWFRLGTSSDYCGIKDMKPLRYANGDSVILDKLSYESESNIKFDNKALSFEPDMTRGLFDDDIRQEQLNSDGVGLDVIPSTDEKVKMCYDDALVVRRSKNGMTPKGVLLLDCTLPRVYVHGNIFQKASRVQDLYSCQGIKLVVVVNSGKGVSYRFPGQKIGFICNRKHKVTDVLEAIDNHPDYGLEAPIFVFGYTKMRRVISYRSTWRVPTHMILYLGNGHSVENMIQALGRATFNGKKVLESNGHSHVTILAPCKDILTACKYNKYFDEVHDRIETGDSLVTAVDGINRKFLDNSNFTRHTNRKTGQRPKRDNIGHYRHKDAFEAPPLGEELEEYEKQIKQKYLNDRDAKAILYILCCENRELSVESIKEAYDDKFFSRNGRKLAITDLRKKLRAIRDDTLVKENHVDRHVWWEVRYPGYTVELFGLDEWYMNESEIYQEGSDATLSLSSKENSNSHCDLFESQVETMTEWIGEVEQQTENKQEGYQRGCLKVRNHQADQSTIREECNETQSNHGLLLGQGKNKQNCASPKPSMQFVPASFLKTANNVQEETCEETGKVKGENKLKKSNICTKSNIVKKEIKCEDVASASGPDSLMQDEEADCKGNEKVKGCDLADHIGTASKVKRAASVKVEDGWHASKKQRLRRSPRHNLQTKTSRRSLRFKGPK